MATTRFCTIPSNFDGNTYHTANLAANRIKSVVDRRWDTFSSEGLFVLDTTSNPRVTHCWIKGTGITNIAVHNGGTEVAAEDLSSFEVRNAQNAIVSFQQDGFQNILLPLTGAPLTTNEITVTVTGTNRKVFEIAAVNSVVELDAEERFSQMDFTPIWREMTTHRAITGRVKSIPPVNAEPYRRSLDLTVLYLDNASHQPIVNFLYKNPNFCLIPEYSRYPHILFSEATLPDWSLQVRNLVEDLKNHQTLSLTIWEA